jgi:hypothetical protein
MSGTDYNDNVADMLAHDNDRSPPALWVLGRAHELCGAGAARAISDCHFRKTATEYDREPGIKWLGCTEK